MRSWQRRKAARSKPSAKPAPRSPALPTGPRVRKGPQDIHTPKALAQRWGCSERKVVEGIKLGMIDGFRTEVGDTVVWHALTNSPDMDLKDRLDALEEGEPGLPNVDAMLRYDRMRLVADGSTRPIPDFWCREHLLLPDRYEGDMLGQELHGVLTISDKMADALRVRLEWMDVEMVSASPAPDFPGDGKAALLAALGPAVPTLRHTWLDPIGGGAYPDIPPNVVTRLLAVDPAHRPLAIAHTAKAVAEQAYPSFAGLALDHLRIGIVLQNVNRNDPEAIKERILKFMAGEILRGTPPTAVRRAVYVLLVAERDLDRWHDEPLPLPLKTWLRGAQLRVPTDAPFRRAINRFVTDIANDGLAGRKVRSDPIRDAYSEQMAELKSKLDEAQVIHDKIEEGHHEAGRRPPFRFSFPLAEKDEDGRDTGRSMLVLMESVTVEHLCARLKAEARQQGFDLCPTSFLRAYQPGGVHEDKVTPGRRVVIYRGVEAVEPGAEPRPPHMMAAYENAATLSPAGLPAAVLERRRRYLSVGDLPVPAYRPRGLIGGTDSIERKLMWWAMRLTGEVVYPSASYLLGASTAHLGHLTQLRSGGQRGGTITQMLESFERGWGSAPVDGKQRPVFFAKPKYRDERLPIPVHETVPIDMRRHVDLITKIEGGFGPVPPSWEHPRGSASDVYALQVQGVAVGVRGLNYCVSHVFGRLIFSNDPRHATAGKLADLGASAEQVGDVLINTPPVARKYMARGEGSAAARLRDLVELCDDLSALGNRPKRRRRA